jgi:hypothetical protein
VDNVEMVRLSETLFHGRRVAPVEIAAPFLNASSPVRVLVVTVISNDAVTPALLLLN